MLGQKRLHFHEIDSTNTYAKSIVREGDSHGIVITADYQHSGRGRLDRRWEAPRAQNLLCTYILHPERGIEDWGGLPLLAGLAVAESVFDVSGLDARLKWPNDVLIGGRKASGILVESGMGAQSWAIIGIGVNVNQVEFPGEYRLPPTSLAQQTGRTFDVEELLSVLSARLDLRYREWVEHGSPVIVDAWSAMSDMIGATIVLIEDGRRSTVTASCINPDCSLRVVEADGTYRDVYAADVSITLPTE